MDGNCLEMINHVLIQCEQKEQVRVCKSPIAERFHLYFEVTPAYVEALIRQAKRIRYQGYYQDLKNNQKIRYSTCMEEDEYDSRSIHCVIWYRKSSIFAGSVRIILPDPTNSENIFPIEKNENIIKDIFEHLFIDRENIAEISPIAVSKEFKKRKGEGKTVSGVSPYLEIKNYVNDERLIFPHINLGLLAATFITSAEYGITHWYALLEPPFKRLLESFEMYFSPIGPPINKNNSTLIPTIASVNELLLAIQDKRPDYWEFILDIARRWQSSRRIKAGLNILKN